MPVVLHHLKAAPLDLGQKGIAPHQTFDITDLALDDTALARLARGEKLFKPNLGGQMFGQE